MNNKISNFKKNVVKVYIKNLEEIEDHLQSVSIFEKTVSELEEKYPFLLGVKQSLTPEPSTPIYNVGGVPFCSLKDFFTKVLKVDTSVSPEDRLKIKEMINDVVINHVDTLGYKLNARNYYAVPTLLYILSNMTPIPTNLVSMCQKSHDLLYEWGDTVTRLSKEWKNLSDYSNRFPYIRHSVYGLSLETLKEGITYKNETLWVNREISDCIVRGTSEEDTKIWGRRKKMKLTELISKVKHLNLENGSSIYIDLGGVCTGLIAR